MKQQPEIISMHDDNAKSLSVFVDKFKIAEKFDKAVDKFNENFLLSKLIEGQELLKMNDVNWWFVRLVENTNSHFKEGNLCSFFRSYLFYLNDETTDKLIDNKVYLIFHHMLNRFYDNLPTNHGVYGKKYKDQTKLEKLLCKEYLMNSELSLCQKFRFDEMPKIEISRTSKLVSENYPGKRIDKYSFGLQEYLLDNLNLSKNLEEITETWKKDVDYLKNYYLSNSKNIGTWRNISYGGGPVTTKKSKNYYVLNKYGQPLWVCDEESLKFARISTTDNEIVIHIPITTRAVPFNFDIERGRIVELKFDISTNTFSGYRLIQRTYCKDDQNSLLFNEFRSKIRNF